MSWADASLEAMRTDPDSRWAHRLTRRMARAPLVPEHEIDQPRSGMRLTQGELAALRYASHGMDARATGDLLGISEAAARMRWRTAKAKNTCHACCEAIRQELIP